MSRNLKMSQRGNLTQEIYQHVIILVASVVAYLVVSYLSLSGVFPQWVFIVIGCPGSLVIWSYFIILVYEGYKISQRIEVSLKDSPQRHRAHVDSPGTIDFNSDYD